MSELIHVSVTKPGKLGLQFTRMIPPYIVKTVPEALSSEVAVGDLLTDIQLGEDPFEPFTSVRETDWQQFVSLISSRPITLRFQREKSSQPVIAAESSPESVSPMHVQEATRAIPAPLVLPSIEIPQSIPISAPTLQSTPSHAQSTPVSRLPPNSFEVVFAEHGPLGLQFDITQYPFEVSKAEGVALTSGISTGDCLERIGNNSTKNLTWIDVQRLLSSRPVSAFFVRPIISPVRRPEKFPGQLESVIEEQRSLLEFEKLRNDRLQAALEAATEEHARRTASLEQAVLSKNSQLIETRAEVDRLAALHAADGDLHARLDAVTDTVSEMGREKNALTLQVEELTHVADACMRKLQNVLDERPLFIDRRMVINALSEFLKSTTSSQASINRLSQVLGFTEDERTLLSPARREDLAQAFVSYLEHS